MPKIYHEMDYSNGAYHKYLPYAPTSSILRYSLEPQIITATAAVHFQHLQYLRYAEPLELTACPLDLSVKNQQSIPEEAPITPPTTPSPGHKRPAASVTPNVSTHPSDSQPSKKLKTTTSPTKQRTKVVRKLNFDEDKSSPVSGTIIRELGPDETLVVRKGDIDPAFNVVEVTEEAKAELAKIDNHIGDYVCRLCRELYEDAFGLAQHRCSRIVHVEYRCPECDKVFNCPANLASHRRWHKPRPTKDKTNTNSNSNSSSQNQNQNQNQTQKESKATAIENSAGTVEEDTLLPELFPCGECGKKFRRLAYLRKHQATHLVSQHLGLSQGAGATLGGGTEVGE